MSKEKVHLHLLATIWNGILFKPEDRKEDKGSRERERERDFIDSKRGSREREREKKKRKRKIGQRY